jgi:hypothetical protein
MWVYLDWLKHHQLQESAGIWHSGLHISVRAHCQKACKGHHLFFNAAYLKSHQTTRLTDTFPDRQTRHSYWVKPVKRETIVPRVAIAANSIIAFRIDTVWPNNHGKWRACFRPPRFLLAPHTTGFQALAAYSARAMLLTRLCSCRNTQEGEQ